MKIISQFKDYYDSVSTHSTLDNDPIYIRKTREVNINTGSTYHGIKNNPDAKVLEPLLKILKKMPSFDSHYCEVIVFCGKVYPFYRHITHPHPCFYSLDKIIKANPDNKKLLDTTKSNTWRWSAPRLNVKTWEIFKQNFVPETISDDVFRHFDSPVIILTHTNTVPTTKLIAEINPRLNQYDFASQIDPFTAFQELDMFIGSNLAKQVDQEPRGITDDLKRDYHGFDKWSFKNKSKKK